MSVRAGTTIGGCGGNVVVSEIGAGVVKRERMLETAGIEINRNLTVSIE
jgi:hypothetical protein